MCRRGGGDETGCCALYSVGEGKKPLRVRAFYVRLAVRSGVRLAPESLTLVYLPRINGAPLEVNGERVRPDAPAFVALHRMRSAESGAGDLVYGSADRVRARDGIRFEAYVGDERALRGSFRRRENGEWRLECGCAGAAGVAEAELWVAGEGELLMRERVDMTAAAASRRGRFCSGLEEIPEEPEEGDGYCDCYGGEEEEEDGWEVLRSSDETESESEEEEDDDDAAIGENKWKLEKEEEAEESAGLEGVKWAVDLGICAVCLGVGFLVSKASFKRRRSFLSF